MRPRPGVKGEGQLQTCKELWVPEKQLGSEQGLWGAGSRIPPQEGSRDRVFSVEQVFLLYLTTERS